MRKFTGSLAFAVLLVALAQLPAGQTTLAQEEDQRGQSKKGAESEGAGSGTSPSNMGSSGWTGPHKGDHTGTDQKSADQPLTATGKDLKGPPVRFPPAKTPE